ncbi:MAG: TrkA family potassium uptake protein [Phycisphaerales bacterium]|nr:MAG: TrkA family potassium uptake protein [Phycisphaerales bacterium]
MEKFAVIGLGWFGRDLARALTSTGAEVIAIDREADLVERIRDQVTLAVRLDSTDADALEVQGVSEVGVAIVGIGVDFESAVLTVAILKEFGIKRIIARAENNIQAKILTRVGANEIAMPEGESALRWAHRLMLPNLEQYIELGEGHSIIYTTTPRRFHDKALRELDLRNKCGVNLIAIERRIEQRTEDDTAASTTTTIIVPNAETKIIPNDVLILVGSNESLSDFPRDSAS